MKINKAKVQDMLQADRALIRDNADYTVRTEMLQGRRHLVVPIVMLRVGVHNGSGGPLFYPKEELGKFPGSWNGIPVTIQHPEENGCKVSANSPCVANDWVVGRVFNTTFDGDRLKAEAWLEEERLVNLSSEAFGYLKSQRPLEVSTGLFSDDEMIEGVWNGEEYAAIAKNYRPDHLALLPGERGACSWMDGCGVRANMKCNIRDDARAPKYNGKESSSWADTDKGMEAFITGYFLKHPGKKDPKAPVTRVANMPQEMKDWIAERSLLGKPDAHNWEELSFFPVVNPISNKLNEGALRAVIGGRGAQAEIPDAVKESAQAKARTLLEEEFEMTANQKKVMDQLAQTEKSIKEAEVGMGRFTGLFKTLRQAIGAPLTDNEVSLDRIRETLWTIVNGYDKPNKTYFLQEVFPDYFLYREEASEGDVKMYRQSYQVTAEDKVELTGDPVEGTLTFVENKVDNNETGESPNTNQKEENVMEERIKALIEGGLFTEDDRAYLDTLSECKVKHFEELLAKQPKDNTEGEEPPAVDPPAAEEVAPADSGILPKDNKEQEPPKPKTVEEYLRTNEELPPEIRETLSEGVKMLKEKRTKLVKGILANKRNRFTEDRLKTMKMEELEALSDLAVEKDFSGNVGGSAPPAPKANERQEDGSGVPPTPKPKWNKDGSFVIE